MAFTIKQKAYIALIATSIIWGTTWVASKVAVTNAPPVQVSAIRQFIAGLIYIVFFKLKGEPWPSLKQLKPLLVMSFFLLIIANGCATWSIKYLSSGLAALIAALYPLCVVVIEMIFFKTKNTKATFIGLLLGLAGICVVFYDNAFHHNSGNYLFGVMLSLIATLSWGIGTIFVARKKININPYYGMGWQMMMASPFIFIMSLFTGKNISLTGERDTALKKVEVIKKLGSVLHVSNIRLVPEHIKKDGTDKETKKARKTNVLKMTFDIDENHIASFAIAYA